MPWDYLCANISAEVLEGDDPAKFVINAQLGFKASIFQCTVVFLKNQLARRKACRRNATWRYKFQRDIRILRKFLIEVVSGGIF